MLLLPSALSVQTLDRTTLKEDADNCVKGDPCGAGKLALYLGGFVFDRRRYVPYTAISRVYKQVAMSKGGFTGRGLFGSIPYLVVEYDGGKVFKSRGKWEEDIDRVLDRVHQLHPEIPIHSVSAEKKIEEERAEIRRRLADHISPAAEETVKEIEKAEKYILERPDLYRTLQYAGKAKRANMIANPFYKWAALAIVILSAVAAAFGLYTMYTGTGDFGVYFLCFGMAFILLFSGANVLPTRRNNEKYVTNRLHDAYHAIEAYLHDYDGTFPTPSRYAHPLSLRRMKRNVLEGRAESAEEALNVMKDDFRKVNNTMTVYQFEYDEIVAIKPLMLVEDYK